MLGLSACVVTKDSRACSFRLHDSLHRASRGCSGRAAQVPVLESSWCLGSLHLLRSLLNKSTSHEVQYYFGLFGGVLLLVLDSSASSLRLSCRRLLACCRLCGGWLLLLRQGVFVSGALCFSFFCTRTSLHHTRIGLSFTRTLACAAFRQAWRSVHFPRGCRGRRWCICAAPP